MFKSASEITRAGYNGFTWEGKNYSILASLGSVLLGQQVDINGTPNGGTYRIPLEVLGEQNLIKVNSNIDKIRPRAKV